MAFMPRTGDKPDRPFDLVTILAPATDTHVSIPAPVTLDDKVNHPNHYTVGGIEVIDILRAKLTREEFIGFLKGNCIKYLLRANHKNGPEDYAKARFYADVLAGFEPREYLKIVETADA